MDTAERERQRNNLLILIGNNIRKYRKLKNWSQEDLANESDVDRTYLGYIENARHNVSIFILNDLANALEVSILQLLSDLET